MKYCHFFNNSKVCPYKLYGCKFKHSDSKNCRYGEKCKKTLCQFKHPSNQSAAKVISPLNYLAYDPEEDADILNEEQFQTYEEDENFVEYIDSKEIFYKQHRIKDLPDDLMNGNDIECVVGLRLKETTESCYPCDACEFTSTNMTIHESHYIEKHGNIANKFNCVVDKCDYISDIPKKVIIHMALKHILLIQRKLGKL